MSSGFDVTMGPAGEPLDPAAATERLTKGSSRTRPVSGEQPGAVIGDYKLLQQLGEGGFGTVWLAAQYEPVQRKVALKIIKLGMDTREVIARFEAERQALAMMDHPHIARVLDAGATDSGRPFFVMELVKGEPVTEYCDRNQVSVEDRLALFVQVCQAVQHAHTKGIIHRDLKPSNVLVSTQDGKPHAKVIDFGIAKATASKLTEKTIFTAQQQLIGTPEYMSPEQAEGSLDIDTRTDVYSLGVLLYELLTGSTPFEGATLRTGAYVEIQRIIREKDPPRPSVRLATLVTLNNVAAQRHSEPRQLTSMLKGELDWIAMKAIEKDRQRRYETASALAADVERYLRGDAVSAAPPSRVYQLRKFVRRYRHAVSAAALVMLALILGVAGTSLGLIEARRQGREAQAARETAERRLAQLQMGTDLLTGIFADLDLQRVKDSGVALEYELGNRLAKAAEQLDGESMGDPLTVAGLQERMGISLHRLGHPAPAAEVLEKSVATRRQELGERHPDTLASMHQLAVSYLGLGRAEDALKLTEQVARLRGEVLGPQHAETLKSMNNLSVLYGRAGRRDEALKLREEILARRRETLDRNHPDMLSSMQALANSYLAANRHNEALALMEETRVLLKATLGADDPRTLLSMSSIASTYSMMGRHSDAIALYQETLALQRARLGPDHPSTLSTMHNLAGSYRDFGRHSDALKLHGDTLSLQREKLGDDHPDTLATMGGMALCYAAMGDHARAAKLQEETLALQRANLGPDHPDTLTSRVNLGSTYRALGQHQKALDLNQETVTLMTASFGADDPYTLVAKHNVADCYGALGRHEESLKLRQETAAAFLAKLGPDHPHTLMSMGSPAVSYHEMGRIPEALALRQRTLEAMKAKFGPEDPETLGAMHSLGQSYCAAGQHEQALKIFEEALNLRNKAIGANHPDTLLTVGAVVRCLEKLDRREEALRLLDSTFLAVTGSEADPARLVPVQSLRVMASQLRGDPHGAEEAVDRLVAALPKDYQSLFDLACHTARLAATYRLADATPAGQQRAQEAAEQAMSLLKQAIDAGYRNAPYLEQEPALDGLRSQEQFDALLAALVVRG